MGHGWSIAGFVVACFGLTLGVLFAVLGVLYAGVTLVTGAPAYVQLSALRLFYIIALPSVSPFAVIGGVLSVVGVQRARTAGETRGRRWGVAGIILAGVGVVVLISGLPLLLIEPCFDLYCD